MAKIIRRRVSCNPCGSGDICWFEMQVLVAGQIFAVPWLFEHDCIQKVTPMFCHLEFRLIICKEPPYLGLKSAHIWWFLPLYFAWFCSRDFLRIFQIDWSRFLLISVTIFGCELPKSHGTRKTRSECAEILAMLWFAAICRDFFSLSTIKKSRRAHI